MKSTPLESSFGERQVKTSQYKPDARASASHRSLRVNALARALGLYRRSCFYLPFALLCIFLGNTSFAAGKPTTIIFLSDDHGLLDSTPYGSTEVRTPNMQRSADSGLTFARAFIASPACAPSRAALLTGLMPARNGAENNRTFKRNAPDFHVAAPRLRIASNPRPSGIEKPSFANTQKCG